MAETSASRTAHSGMVTGLFPDRESAERAYGSMVERGYGQDDVNLVMSDETRKKHFAADGRETELGSKALVAEKARQMLALELAQRSVAQLEQHWPQSRQSEPH